jgi:hypothetical protein
MNNIKAIIIKPIDEKRIRVITEDTEYGVLNWSMDEAGHLFCAEGANPQPEDWEPWEDLPMPWGGDAAIELENATAELVRAAFKLDIRKP